MKRSVLAGLLITGALLASPAFAAEDLCDVNLQKVKDGITSAGTIGEPAQGELLAAQRAAQMAKDNGDDKACIAESQRAIQILADAQKGKG
jgi:hypothetical protein